MRDREWTAYFSARLEQARKELADFEEAVTKYGLRTFDHDVNGQRETTERSHRTLQEAVAEYERVLRDK